MPRPAKFSNDEILDVSRDLVVESGTAALTMAAVARKLKAPSGSLYHRFPRRNTLAAAVWLRSVRRFQDGYIAQLSNPDPLTAALGAAAHVVTWSRANLSDARLLLLFRSGDLLHDGWPEDLQQENLQLRRRLRKSISELQAAFDATDPASRHRVTFAVIDVPYAAIRPGLLAGEMPPASTDRLVTETVENVLGPLVRKAGKEQHNAGIK